MDLNIQYLAGLFDGEGSVGVYGNGANSHNLRVQIVQTQNSTTLPVWLELQRKYGGGLSKDLPSTSGRPKMNWSLSSQKAADFLREIQPYLILKKTQVDLALQWWNTRAPRQRGARGRILPLSSEALQRAEDVVNSLRQMKKE